MNISPDSLKIHVDPGSNRNLLEFSILSITVRLEGVDAETLSQTQVIIRTNLNQARAIRRQTIALVEKGQSSSTDFYDIPATWDSRSGLWRVDVLLSEVGYFEFKARAESIDPRRPWVVWADGTNIGISVTPLEYGRNNSIYCAWVRQFCPRKDRASLVDEPTEENIRKLEKNGAYVLPPGGDFEHFKQALPFIINELGMKIIHLLPINPVPTSYGRMGMYGSPYATTDYFGIDHTYATFSRYKTIEDQFIDVTSTIHGLGAKVFLDMVINHTGWASTIHFTHRHWRKVGPDGQIKSPGAWGVVWGDLVELDYRHKDLWRYMADVLLCWCSRGIDGFRLDAGYMIPTEVWKYLISKVRQEYPNTLFLLEGLGGPWATTEELITHGQMNWAYSELFQNYNRQEIHRYLEYAQQVSERKGVLVHYAETHDNDRLAKKGKVHTRMRLHLCALSSFSGAWGFTNGVEWLATEKIDVHRNTGLNWGSKENLVADIARLNRILGENPAFWERDNLCWFDSGQEDVAAFTRSDKNENNVLVCAVNLNCQSSCSMQWKWTQDQPKALQKAEHCLHNLLNGQKHNFSPNKSLNWELEPGGCFVGRLEPIGQPYHLTAPALFDVEYERIALIYRILLNRFPPHQVGRLDQERLLREVTNFRRFIAVVNRSTLRQLMGIDLKQAMTSVTDEDMDTHTAVWTFHSSNKAFMLSGDQWLIANTPVPCTAYLETPDGKITQESIHNPEGVGHVVFFAPLSENQTCQLSFNWKIRRGSMIQRQRPAESFPIVSVPSGHKRPAPRRLYPITLQKTQLSSDEVVLETNSVGAISQYPARPHHFNSKYDTLLALMTNPMLPARRVSLVKGLRETVEVGQKCFDLDDSFLVQFTRYPHPKWEFHYDDGEHRLRIERTIILSSTENALTVRYRLNEGNTPTSMIVKCLVEYRSMHDQVRAGQNDGLRQAWEQACRVLDQSAGYIFAPGGQAQLQVVVPQGEYIHQPHWMYNLNFPLDAERGLEDHGDAFAPGVFRLHLSPGKSNTLVMTTGTNTTRISTSVLENEWAARRKDLFSKIKNPATNSNTYVRMLALALDQFIVQTPGGYRLLGGYPWLPMCSAGALQCAGGLLTAGRGEVVKDVILAIARTEQQGLIEDMPGESPARGQLEPSLRLYMAAADYVGETGDETLWDTPVGDGRTLREVLVDIFEHLTGGIMPSGVRVDEKTGLLYCPAGFSWMNTTYPQATPREGYPVEIQALWSEVLPILARLFPPYAEQALELRGRLDRHFLERFWRDRRGWLADVLLAGPGTPASQGLPDMALRFNQLAAIQAGMVSIEQARQIVDIISERLLIPGAVRSLSEDPLAVPRTILDSQGKLLADPHRPYQGRCEGDETRRRTAYHNGTAWLWAYPAFIESRAVAYGYSPTAVRQALAYFEPLWSDLTHSGIGTLGEMKDGDTPHRSRGCNAYAVSVAEALRVYSQLRYPNNHNGRIF